MSRVTLPTLPANGNYVDAVQLDNIFNALLAGVNSVDNTQLATGAALANIGTNGVTSQYLALANNLNQIGWFSVKDYGATGQGVADDSSAVTATITAAAAGGLGNTTAGIFFPPGTYFLNSSFTVTCPVVMAPGAIIQMGPAVTFTFNGPFTASLQRCFATNVYDRILFGRGSTVYPEWWGAVNSASVDSSYAFNNALYSLLNAGGGVVRLQPYEYAIASTILHNVAYCRLEGCGSQITQINCTTSGMDALHVLYPGTLTYQAGGGGTNPSSGGGTNFLQWPQVRGMSFIQPSPTGTTAGGYGLTLCYTAEATVEDVACIGFYVGYTQQRATNTNVRYVNCSNTYSAGPNNSVGFYINGSGQQYDSAPNGGNASTRFLNCSHSNVSATAYAGYGWLINNPSATYGGTIGDLHFINPETNFCNFGMYFDFTNSLTTVDSSSNIFVDNPTLDTNIACGIYVNGNIYTSGASQSMAMKFSGGWINVAPVSGNNEHIAITNSRGLMFQNMQFMAPSVAATNVTTGLIIQDSNQIKVHGCTFMSLDHWITMQTSVHAPGYCTFVGNTFYGSAETSGVEGGHTPNPGFEVTGTGNVVNGNTFDGKYGGGIVTALDVDSGATSTVVTSNVFNKATAAPAAGGTAVAIITNTIVNSGTGTVLANNIS
jgi:hypothetical protein